jgi:acetylornithine deacetylase/succinyl-diaminopimelate desuccinylase-like protein
MPEDALGRALAGVFAHIDQQREAFVARLIDYVRHPSISALGVGIAEVAALVADHLSRLGFEAHLMPTPGWPMVVGRRVEQPGGLTVLLYGHYDVQPADPLEAWDSPPFEPTIRDGRLYARGVGDNKGQHFAQLLALESLLAVHGRLPLNVIVLLEGEEEVGSPHLAAFVRHQRRLLKADLVITADGPVHDSGRACLEFGVRGILSFELRARGAKRDLHSGNWGGVAPQPLWSLVHLLSTMRNPHGAITIAGVYDAVQPPTPEEREALAAIPLDEPSIMADLGLHTFDQPVERDLRERLMFWPTLTINGFFGGYHGPGSKTVLPSAGIVKCDMRLVPGQRVADIEAKVRAHVRKHAPDVEFVPLDGMEPSRTPLTSPFTTPLREAFQVVHGEPPLLIPSAGGSLPDYVFTEILGIPAFGTPYANHDEANHAPNENLELWRFIAGIKTGAAVLTALAMRHPPPASPR